MSADKEEWPKCIHMSTGTCVVTPEQRKLTPIHCIICLSGSSRNELRIMLSISSNFIISNAALSYIDRYIGTGRKIKDSLEALTDLLRKEYSKEWNELQELQMKIMPVLATEQPGGEN